MPARILKKAHSHVSRFSHGRDARVTMEVLKSTPVPSPPYSGERVSVRALSASCAARENGPSPRPSPLSTGEREAESSFNEAFKIDTLSLSCIYDFRKICRHHLKCSFSPQTVNRRVVHAFSFHGRQHVFPGRDRAGGVEVRACPAGALAAHEDQAVVAHIGANGGECRRVGVLDEIVQHDCRTF